MTTRQIYDLAVKLAIKNDLRGVPAVQKYLARTKKKYQNLPAKDKAIFDQEKLTNPYSDSRILADHKKKQIKKIMAGIDMEGPELLLAKQLGDIDLVITHHPQGEALVDLSDVMSLQAQVLADYGVPINIAESVIKPRLSEVSRTLSPLNYDRWLDMAKMLGLDFICTHTTADNLSAAFIVKLLKAEAKGLDTVGDVLELLNAIPEYTVAAKKKNGLMIFSGEADDSCGKIVVTEFTGGTNGSKDMYEKMAQYGIGTIIGMHMSEEHRTEAKKYHINVIIASHAASDSLGMNLFLDEIEKQGIAVVPMSGLIRVKRFKK